MTRASSVGSLLGAMLLVLGLGPSVAAAQTPPGTTPSPSLPEGPGTISGRIVHRESGEGQQDIEVALYALKPDGSPGVGGASTASDGRFRFTGLSNDPSVVYLLGARYQEVPFGRRLRFAEGEEALDVTIEIDDATSDASALALDGSSIVIDWMGTEILLTERLRLHNRGNRVIHVPKNQRSETQPVLELELPVGARAFQPGLESFGQALELLPGGRLVHWGPIFPGEQELLYQYRLPTPSSESEPMQIVERFPRGVTELQVLVADTGIRPVEHELTRAEAVEIEGRSYQALEGGPLAAGESLELSLELPELRSDPAALSLARSDHWLELDDASLLVSAEQQLQVEPGARLVGSPESPLVSFALPERAELLGVTNQAASLGVRPGDGSIDVLGPLGAGTSTVAYRYRLPLRTTDAPGSEGTELDLEFPLPAALVNVLVADTGVEVSSERLHRQRPFRNGTRVYLHREGFQVQPDEGVRVHLQPLSRSGIPWAATLGAAITALAAAAWFLAAPLVGRADATSEDRAAGTLDDRERVYETIRDLDHDFETGKIAEADYVEMRGALRREAVELLRREKQGHGASPAAPEAPVSAPEPATKPALGTDDSAELASPVGFCPACGQAAQAGWKFCSACGGALPPTPA